MHDVDWSPLISALTSGGLVAGLARGFLHRTLRDLDDAVMRVSTINERLATLTVRLEGVEKHYHLVYEHDRKIAGMEQVVYGGNRTP